MTRLYGNILTERGWQHGHLLFDGERIVGIDASPADPAGNDDPYLLPGFIDLHVHGGDGADVMDGAEALARVARKHAGHGTTALLATTVCADDALLRALLPQLGNVCRQRPVGAAEVLGIHLEGPYVSPHSLGALPDETRAATLAEVDRYRALAPVRVITLAPEIPGHDTLIGELVQRGIRVQLGHGQGSYEAAVAALAQGAAGFTHLFNAMSPLHHRAPGMVGAALAHAEFSELIPDLIHVHPGAMRAALRAIPRLYCVTDATSLAGLPDGQYGDGPRAVHKCLGGVRLADGRLAGSALTMDQALRNLVGIGLTLAGASACLSRNPADYLGLSERGRLAVDAVADVVQFDRALCLRGVWVAGEAVTPVAKGAPAG
ncbi:N-acetylglucosamine-6-phosphate deacetylase [Chitiniphilus eburneus]|uniref:N-acetylglucosamine-6-phosphate deacetylase n=1 Tax=Chitiniphilus eburneus TaxID=2571148 RepID=A0A4U0PZZ0_9NEIS|nr:N-acetylglucosamine-6-phosphate deacetylase [Chitiniphilus eburneus]TJZ74251.1 N-acetylglucosamine-6-phosphate deacetylase [Chitiniphilus eburneus]